MSNYIVRVMDLYIVILNNSAPNYTYESSSFLCNKVSSFLDLNCIIVRDSHYKTCNYTTLIRNLGRAFQYLRNSKQVKSSTTLLFFFAGKLLRTRNTNVAEVPLQYYFVCRALASGSQSLPLKPS